MTIERRRLTYEGRVQGVGFRMTSVRLASSFQVAGYVRNLMDSRVEMLVEGSGLALTAFLEAVRREFGDDILHVHETHESIEDGRLVGFSIRH